MTIHPKKPVRKTDEIYNLAGQTSVGLSFQQPVETYESVTLGVLNLLEAVRFLGQDIRIYNACSSECFGDCTHEVATEKTAFKPRSPYAVAKAAAFWQTANYREAYGIYACSGILFNHDSPLRPNRFVTQKIIQSALDISAGKMKKLHLGNLAIVRDWGWAPDYVEGMWKMLQIDHPRDFVMATGESHSLETFVDVAFKQLDMDWRDHVVIDDRFIRPTEIMVSRGSPEVAKSVLGWEATKGLEAIISSMLRPSSSLTQNDLDTDTPSK